MNFFFNNKSFKPSIIGLAIFPLLAFADKEEISAIKSFSFDEVKQKVQSEYGKFDRVYSIPRFKRILSDDKYTKIQKEAALVSLNAVGGNNDFSKYNKSDSIFRGYYKFFEARNYGQSKNSVNLEKNIKSLNEAKVVLPSSVFTSEIKKISSELDIALARAYFSEAKYQESRVMYERIILRMDKGEAAKYSKDFNNLLSIYEKVSPNLVNSLKGRIVNIYYGDSGFSIFKNKISKSFASKWKDTYANTSSEIQNYNGGKPPSKIDLDIVLFNNAFEKYLNEDFDGAIAGFKDQLQKYPGSDNMQRAKYWLGKALQKVDAQNAAFNVWMELIQNNPLSYHSALAALETGFDPSNMLAVESTEIENDSIALLPDEVERLERIKAFLSIGAYEMAGDELDNFQLKQNKSANFTSYIAMLAQVAGRHSVASQKATALYKTNSNYFNLSTIDFFLPVEFYDLIEKEAIKSGLDPFVVMSLIKQESGYNAQATSVANAYGLMQLILPTARDMQRGVTYSDLFQPSVNIALGTKYLKQVLDGFKGNLPYALAGYNAGPNRVEKWKEEKFKPAGLGKSANDVLSQAEFIETIPFLETRRYVMFIMRNQAWYNLLKKGIRLKDNALLKTITKEVH